MLLALEDQYFQQSLQEVYTNICNASFSIVFICFGSSILLLQILSGKRSIDLNHQAKQRKYI